jgi:hypothetical protein
VSTPQPPSNAGTSPAPTNVGFRADEQDRAALDELCAQWKLNGSEVLRRLVRAAHRSERVRSAIEDADYTWSPTLPHATRYKLMSAWTGLIGIVHHSFKKGEILSRDLHGPELIQQLHERNAALQPLPD